MSAFSFGRRSGFPVPCANALYAIYSGFLGSATPTVETVQELPLQYTADPIGGVFKISQLLGSRYPAIAVPSSVDVTAITLSGMTYNWPTTSLSLLVDGETVSYTAYVSPTATAAANLILGLT